jgi:hypothetical protein
LKFWLFTPNAAHFRLLWYHGANTFIHIPICYLSMKLHYTDWLLCSLWSCPHQQDRVYLDYSMHLSETLNVLYSFLLSVHCFYLYGLDTTHSELSSHIYVNHGQLLIHILLPVCLLTCQSFCVFILSYRLVSRLSCPYCISSATTIQAPPNHMSVVREITLLPKHEVILPKHSYTFTWIPEVSFSTALALRCISLHEINLAWQSASNHINRGTSTVAWRMTLPICEESISFDQLWSAIFHRSELYITPLGNDLSYLASHYTHRWRRASQDPFMHSVRPACYRYEKFATSNVSCSTVVMFQYLAVAYADSHTLFNGIWTRYDSARQDHTCHRYLVWKNVSFKRPLLTGAELPFTLLLWLFYSIRSSI